MKDGVGERANVVGKSFVPAPEWGGVVLLLPGAFQFEYRSARLIKEAAN
jgi:hypothetical protein